jgi:flavodoxin
LKFFRKIRKQSTNQKKALNYIGYSIGEIFLVVVGILIAVALNNWNQKVQEKKELTNILTTIKKDLQNDIQDIDKILAYHKITAPLYGKILNDSLTKDDYREKSSRLPFLILGYPEISFDKRGFNLLSTYNSNNETTQDTLANHIVDFYNKRLLEIKVDNDFRASDIKDNYYFWKNNYSWWATYIQKKDMEGFIEYALKNPDYKNRVATAYFLTYDIFLPELKTFKEKAEVIINVIEQRRLKK